MKKSLVLAMAMALGVTASAYAANPFSDVPAGHWAYDSIDKLAAAGVIDGMGDGTYQGDKTMTRYEMAQIVAKAMAKGANVDKLAAEFADELDNLGVRVAKLEKKADNVMISGEFRAHYKRMKAEQNESNGVPTSHESALRSRLFLNGKINEDWTYNAMLENEQKIAGLDDGDKVSGKGEEGVAFKRAYVEGKIGGVNVSAGRQAYGWGDAMVQDDDLSADAIVLSYGSKIKVEGVYGQASDGEKKANKFYGAKVEYTPIDDLAIKAEYAKFKEIEGTNEDAKVADVGVTYAIGDFELSGIYIRGAYDGVKSNQKKGYVFGVGYKGADAEEPGTWGLNAHYYNQGNATFVNHSIDGNTFDEGFKGWSIGADYALAKNIVAEISYYDTKEKEDSSKKDKVIWSAVTFSF